MEASGASVGGQAGGSRAAEVESSGTGQGGVARQAGGVSRSGPALGAEIHGDGTRGAAATNDDAGVRHEAGQRGHHGITKGPDAALAGHLDNEDHVERLLQRRLAAERELKGLGGPLIFSAGIWMRSVFRAQTQPPAWVSKALQSGEEYYRASLYTTFNVLAIQSAFATVAVLCLYHLKDHLQVPVSAERVLTTVRLTMFLTLMFMGMSLSVGVAEDLRGAATMFLAIVVTVAVAILLALGKLKIGQ